MLVIVKVSELSGSVSLSSIDIKINASYSVRANPDHKKWYSSPVESKIISLIENGTMDGFVSDCMFKHINKINIKKLASKLNCSDKTAKKFINLHASYLLE